MSPEWSLRKLLGLGAAGSAPASAPAADRPPPPIDVQALVDRIDDPVLVIDARKRVELANRAARDFLGAHIVGEDVRLAIRHPAAAALLGSDSAGAAVQTIDLVGFGHGDRRWELRLEPMGERRVVRLIDRTEARAAERMRVDFVANASHELRTPLTTLLGFIETLEGPAADDEQARRRFLGIMRAEGERMKQLIDELMSLSRIEAEKHSAPTAAVDLVALAREVGAGLSLQLEVDGRQLVIDSAADVPAVAGDHGQLQQLLSNLIANAIKYGRKDTPITVRIRPSGDAVQLSVEDEGEGIPPEHLPRLTERFYRVDPGRSRALGGTGLGLAIVKHIAERHRGRLEISSVVGKGTRVMVTLPAMPGNQ